MRPLTALTGDNAPLVTVPKALVTELPISFAYMAVRLTPLNTKALLIAMCKSSNISLSSSAVSLASVVKSPRSVNLEIPSFGSRFFIHCSLYVLYPANVPPSFVFIHSQTPSNTGPILSMFLPYFSCKTFPSLSKPVLKPLSIFPPPVDS